VSQPIVPRPDPPKPEDVQAQYGFVTLLAKQIPEISGVLDQATRESWTSDRFSMAIANTNWWRTTPAATRQWVTQQISDPATATAAMNTGASKVEEYAVQLGADTPSLQRAGEVWLAGKLFGLSDSEMLPHTARMLLGGDANPVRGGLSGQLMNKMYADAINYGYNAPDMGQEIADQSKYLLWAGSTSPDAWHSKMINYAMTKYAPYADRIRGGETVRDIATPFLESRSKILEEPTTSLHDPLIERALQGQLVDGKSTAPSLYQFEQDLRKDPRWGYTQNARQATAQAAASIGKTFGMIG